MFEEVGKRELGTAAAARGVGGVVNCGGAIFGGVPDEILVGVATGEEFLRWALETDLVGVVNARRGVEKIARVARGVSLTGVAKTASGDTGSS
jgi:hypothetical protein